MGEATPVYLTQAEPLARMSDLAEYKVGLEQYLAGKWDDERWTAYRTRYGIYGQKQPGVQMIRIKVPGGVLPVSWLRAISGVNREFAVGDGHITTRQDIQLYHVPLRDTPALMEKLYSAGVTTREAGGSTLRNMNACALAGACPRELVDAGRVAEILARSFIRHPLVQHMPRKAKFSVSGCATDCGHSALHDLAFIATTRDGVNGFKVTAGGGLGALPRAAIDVIDFVTEDDLPAVVEAFARLHQRYSDRRNRNASRMKFLVKRFGEQKFVELFREDFERVRALPQRSRPKLAWRQPEEAAVARAPVGVVNAHDGSAAIVLSVPLGLMSSDQMDALADIAERAGVTELRTTRDQNLVFLGVPKGKVAEISAAAKAIGFDVPASAEDVPDVISCPGTTTCRIGINNSQNFAKQALASANADPLAKGVSIHVSGCQNSCGLHHVADFGLHGMAKKVDGRSAPHYQFHFGGDARTGEVGLSGPIVPARLADEALALLRAAYGPAKAKGETVRAWAGRLGKDGINAILAPIDGKQPSDLFIDWGDTKDFPGAPPGKGECAAASGLEELYADLADDGLISLDRSLAIGNQAGARAWGLEAVAYAGRRLLDVKGTLTEDGIALDAVLASLTGVYAGNADVLGAVDAALAAKDGDVEDFREAVAYLIDTARAVAEAPAAPVEAAVGDLDAILGVAE